MTDGTRSSGAEDDAGGWLEDFDVPEEAEDPPPPAQEVTRDLIRIERSESAARLVIGGIAVLAGLALFFLGFSGLAQWGIQGLGLSPQLQTCAAGVLVALIGLCFIAVTRPKIRIAPVQEADEVPR